MKIRELLSLNVFLKLVLVPNIQYIAWDDMLEGNPCFDPTKLEDFNEELELSYAAFKLSLVVTPRSGLHRQLADGIAKQLGVSWISYAVLIKVLSRLIAWASLSQLYDMIERLKKKDNSECPQTS